MVSGVTCGDISFDFHVAYTALRRYNQVRSGKPGNKFNVQIVL